jgi:acetyltransferase-like isoleucine patch superfamily enzyme
MYKSFTYKLITKLGMNISHDEYHDISFFRAMSIGLIGLRNALLLKYCMYSVLLSVFNYRVIRPYLWKKMGCTIGKNVFIGYSVWFDYNNANLIEIGDNVHITNMCLLLCHQRDIDNYLIGINSTKLPYKKGKIIIQSGVMIGMNSTIMPGVTIGEGSIIGAKSLVLDDVPPWTIVAGNPAKVIKKIKNKDEYTNI